MPLADFPAPASVPSVIHSALSFTSLRLQRVRQTALDPLSRNPPRVTSRAPELALVCSLQYDAPQRQLASLFRDSSALRISRLSPAISATMASADFSHALPQEISPSKVRNLSARAARLYLTCLSVTVGFRVC